jgi:hypothetical protein
VIDERECGWQASVFMFEVEAYIILDLERDGASELSRAE